MRFLIADLDKSFSDTVKNLESLAIENKDMEKQYKTKRDRVQKQMEDKETLSQANVKDELDRLEGTLDAVDQQIKRTCEGFTVNYYLSVVRTWL